MSPPDPDRESPALDVASASAVTEAAAPATKVQWLRMGGLVASVVVLTAIAPYAEMRWWERIAITFASLAVAFELAPDRRFVLAAVGGVLVLAQWRPTYAPIALLLLGALYGLRRRPIPFLVVLVGGTIVLPKELFRLAYHHTWAHAWVPDPLLAHLFLVGLLWWVERRRVPAFANPTFAQWLTLFVFPTQPLNPMNFGPSELWRERASELRSDLRAVGESLVIVAGKGLALWGIGRYLSGYKYGAHSFASLSALPLPQLWAVLFVNYLVTALTLSGTGDVVIALARIFGFRLEHPFRWALLAWNPVELWRRWAIYNRKLLLKLVYFPLGGNRKRRYLNVMATFVASGLVLHSGWTGSKWWEAGAAGWRDQTAYFLLQGAAVCACLMAWQLVGKDPASDRRLRLSPSRIVGTVLTQAMSAWMHVLVLAGGLGWGERWRLMARALGL